MNFSGLNGVIMGVANQNSIAASIANCLHQNGASLAFSHLPDTDDRGRMAARVQKALSGIDPVLVAPCDVTKDEDIERFFSEVSQKMPSIDFVVHSIAFAPLDDIRCETIDASRNGFLDAMNISCYSLISVARAARKLMKDGGSIAAMTYFGGEKVVPGYNMMGICKSALESTVKYLAYDLGPEQIRVNSVSAGPLKTLAASAIGDFSEMLNLNAAISPLRRNVTKDEVAQSTAFLLSPGAKGITGENLHVDGGFNIMGGPGRALSDWQVDLKKSTPTVN